MIKSIIITVEDADAALSVTQAAVLATIGNKEEKLQKYVFLPEIIRQNHNTVLELECRKHHTRILLLRVFH